MNYETIINEFKKQFGHLQKAGLEIHGIANLIGDHNVISISTPFIFDRTKLPKKIMGLDLREGITELPKEFQDINDDKEYIWAYQRFEEYVDNHADLIRNVLSNPEMKQQEMLDALCFGDFNSHKEKCIEWEKEGKIPKWASK
ncbi:hypothetical protein [Lacibacter sediminis]|uniref:Uncharacterized protein n=1 Tax=Lacibacter sediminis TaxID=2760713 RepID=A0A7G5XH70_9BACT|nr:hypothetical protein [Lacibacter sediminis]QNA44823.1 hypothetical protein H4075_01090 [Lacibacter sediminis]